MVKRVFAAIASLIFTLSFVSLTDGYENNPNRENGDWIPYTKDNINSGKIKGGHDTLTVEGMLLKKKVHKDNVDFQNWADTQALPSLRIGAHDEDTIWWLIKDPPIGSTGRGDFFNHFYNYRKDKKGFKGRGKPAPQRAKDYIKEIKNIAGCTPSGITNADADKKKAAYEYFGKSLHLLQDMGAPSHTSDDAHPFRKPFERYVNDHWDRIVNSPEFIENANVEQYLNGNYEFSDIFQYWDSLAAISSEKFSEEELCYLYHDPVTGADYYVVNEIRLKENVDELIPKTIMHTAGFIDAIYDYITGNTGGEEAKCALTNYFLGKDHPDDRFDVSDEFYWEKEFGISEADLTDLFMRTAMKKGKMGLWYWKQFVEIYAEAITKYENAPKEEQDRMEAEYRAIEQKLEERRNFAEVDWKGAPDVALFAYGFHDSTISLLLKFKEPVAFIGLDFDPSIVKDHPVMIIPSGGLFGIENSSILKAKFAEYVKNGGILIVFTQQHGYEFSILPVPQETDGTFKQIAGYGWTEDQSCFNRAVYIDTYHQILSGQNKSTPSLNVDGYFTDYPSGTTVLLRRTSNGQPAMIMYDYGQGKVIVGSLYSDWAHGHSQASKEETDLVRDMISWSKNPATLPEIKLYETVSVSVVVTNHTTLDASSIKLLIYDPDRENMLSSQTIAASILAGQSLTIPVSYNSATQPVFGIHHIDYELYDENGVIIQPQTETDSGRFSVSKRLDNPYKSPDFNFSIQSDAELYLHGSSVTFTVIAWNNTDENHTITFKYYLPNLGPDGTYSIEAPANSSVSFNIVAPEVKNFGWLKGAFYDESGRQVGYAGKGIWMAYPSVNVAVQTDKTLYVEGESVYLTLNVQNKQSLGYSTNLKVNVTDPSNANIYSSSVSVTLAANGTSTQNLSFPLPPTVKNGLYIVSAEVNDTNGKKIAESSASFEVPSAMLSINPVLPATFTPNSTFQASFEVKNIWIKEVPSANLKVDFIDPAGNILFTNIEEFSITSGLTKIFLYNIPTGHEVFGNYRLQYILTYGDRIASGEKVISRSYTIQNNFDKVTYSTGETVNGILNITNRGEFQDDLSLKVEVPEFGYSRTSSASISPQQTVEESFSIPVPGDATSGKHSLIVTLGTASVMKTFDFYLPESKLELSATYGTYSAGDSISIAVNNTGGGGTNYELNTRLTDMKGVVVSNQNFAASVLAKDTKVHNITIPSGAFSGQYILKLSVKDKITGRLTNFDAIHLITGISGNLSIRTEKDVYLNSEGIRVVTDITSTGMSIQDAELNIKVIPAMKTSSIRGTVINAETSIPIQGAKISIGDKDTYTTSQGEYVLTNVSPGIQALNIIYPGFDRVASNINVLEGSQTYDAALLPSKYGTLRNIITDSMTLQLLVGAKIEIIPIEVLSSDAESGTSYSNFDGVSEIELPIGSYNLRVTKEGYNLFNTEILLNEGLNERHFALNKTNSQPQITGELSGKVINEVTGDVLLGPEVKLDNTFTNRVQMNDQTYNFYNISPGSHTIGVNYAGYNRFEKTIDIGVGQQTYDILLTPSLYGNLTGSVRDASTGNAVIGARIELIPVEVASSDQSLIILHSDFTGSYALNKIPVGTYAVKATRQYYAELNTSVIIQEGNISLNINLQQAEPISEVNETEPNNDLPESTILNLDANGSGTIHPYADVDYYRVYVPSNGTIRVTVSDIPDGQTYNLYLFDSANSTLANTTNVSSPGPAVLNQFVDEGGDYYVRVRNPFNGYSTSPYRIYITYAPQDFPSEEVMFEKTILPINLSGSQTINEDIPAIGITGKFLVIGTLKSSTSQIISRAVYPFYSIKGSTVLLFNTDKEIYNAGEVVKITGEVQNLSSVIASGISLVLGQQSATGHQDIYSSTFDIPANGRYPFTMTTIANTEGAFTLTGRVTQSNSTLVEISDHYEVASPKVTTTVSAPEMAGNEPFMINIELRNEGKVIAVVNLQSSIDVQMQTITILAGETKLIQYTQQIANDTTYTFTFTGNVNQTITKTVEYGLGASIVFYPLTVYPEGRIEVPLSIMNAGQSDESLAVTYSLQPSGFTQSKTYYIAKAGNITDTIYFDLPEGNYQLSAGSQQPTVSSQANFLVRKENKIEMSISAGAQTNELIPVIVNLTNLGYNEISGSINLNACLSGSEQIVWNDFQPVTQLLSQSYQLLTFNINPSSLKPGNYTLKAEFLNNSGQQLRVISSSLTIYGPIFQVTQLPPYQTFPVGEEAAFTFKVKNIGNKEGAFDFNFKAYDLIDSTKKEWLIPSEEKSVTFSFILPIDLEEKDYFADYELKGSDVQNSKGSKGQIKYHLTGINLNINAALDRQDYRKGDTAHLSIGVSQESGTGSLNLFARVNYAEYESLQPFTLNGTDTLTFDILLTEIAGEKLFYGIYHESGRSIHLNSLYIYKTEDVLTITTNKQVYNPGETVSVTMNSFSGADGTLTLSAPNYSETFVFTGTATKNFTLPTVITAGTYHISYEISLPNGETHTGNHPFDIAGISVKIKEAILDKGKYASSDTLNICLAIESNQNLSAILKAWMVDPEGKYTDVVENTINLTSSDNLLFTAPYLLTTAVSGIHRLIYGIYTGDLLLASGSEAFDVGDAILTYISANSTDYPTDTEVVRATVSMYGTVDATLDLQLDGNTIRTHTVSLNGFSTLNIEIGIVEPGTHILKAILTAGNMKSIKESTFTYALSFLDSDNDGMPDEWEAVFELDLNNPVDASLDPDNDGLTNLQEYQHGTNPQNQDTDNDGMPDGWEVTYGLNPDVNDALSDKDNDGFGNLQEYQSGTDPTDPTSVPNQSPVAKAGSDQNVLINQPVTLNGSESFDPEGDMITFLWTFIEVPGASNITDTSLSNATCAKPTFIPDVDGIFKLELTVNDGVLESIPDEVVIAAATPNVAPNANAGSDQNVFTGATVYLDGNGSNDPDNRPQPLSYIWSFSSIPSGSYLTNDHIITNDQVFASFIPDTNGFYIINLNVSDSDLSSRDTVQIMATTPNVPPNANAGSDITIWLGQVANIDCSASNDPDNGPHPLSYRWRFVAVPVGSQMNNADISGADTISPFFTPDISGTYVIELAVSDGLEFDFDNMAVTVIKKSVYCSILGNDPKPSILDQDIFKFNGIKGEIVIIRLNSDPSEAGSGKRVTLLLAAKIPGVLFTKADQSVLPNEIAATLPATGEYLITVAEQPKIARGEKYRGVYCLSLEASPEIMQTLRPALWVE